METVLDSGIAGAAAFMDSKRPTPIVRDAHALLVRGIDARERSHIEEAVGLLRQCVQLDPRSFHGQLALGIALIGAGVMAGASAIFLVGAPPLPAALGITLAVGWLIWRAPRP